MHCSRQVRQGWRAYNVEVLFEGVVASGALCGPVATRQLPSLEIVQACTSQQQVFEAAFQKTWVSAALQNMFFCIRAARTVTMTHVHRAAQQ